MGVRHKPACKVGCQVKLDGTQHSDSGEIPHTPMMPQPTSQEDITGETAIDDRHKQVQPDRQVAQEQSQQRERKGQSTVCVE